MNFAQPNMLWLVLGLTPAVAAFLWWGYLRKQQLIRQFVQHQALRQLTLGHSASRQKLRIVLLVCSVAFLLLALAGPRWGFVWEETAQRGRDIVVAIDASKSMLAADVQPTRLARAKLAALDLMRLARNDRLGLVGFSGTAFLQCPLTLDDEAYRQSVDVLSPNVLPRGGTAVAQAIESALTAFQNEEGENHKILVLFTDGEDHEQGIENAISKAVAAKLKIFTIGVGTPPGELIRVRDERGQSQFLRDDSGNVVKSRLNEKLLQQIASETGGAYLTLQGANTIKDLYQTRLAPLPTTEFESGVVKKFREQFGWPLAIGVALLFIEILIPDIKKRARGPSPASRRSTALNVAIVAACFVAGAQASPSSARKKMEEGAFREALAEYQELLRRKPEDSRLHYNSGVAAYGAKEYEQAISSFQKAVGADDLQLQQQSYYNLGNTHFRMGETVPAAPEKIEAWEQAVKHYESALKLNSQDSDASFNRDLVMKKLEELKKQQQQQQDKQDQNKQDKQDKKDQQQAQNKDEKQQDQEKQSQDDKNQEKQDESNQQQRKEEQQPQNQPQSSPPQPENEQKPGEQPKQDPNKEGDANKQDQNESGDQQEGAEQQMVPLGQMSPLQAKQLLDAQKDNEKALIFLPPQSQDQRRRGPVYFKDW